jgi:hypothetical protein
MSGVQDYLIDNEIKYSKQLAEIAINKVLPTMLDVCKGMAKWLAGQSGGQKAGQQTLQELLKYGDKLSEIPLNSDNISDFTSIARTHGVAFALAHDDSKDPGRMGEQDAKRPTSPPRHTVYFRANDTESMSAAFKEYTAKAINKGKTQEQPFKERMKNAKEKVAAVNEDRATKREVSER